MLVLGVYEVVHHIIVKLIQESICYLCGARPLLYCLHLPFLLWWLHFPWWVSQHFTVCFFFCSGELNYSVLSLTYWFFWFVSDFPNDFFLEHSTTAFIHMDCGTSALYWVPTLVITDVCWTLQSTKWPCALCCEPRFCLSQQPNTDGIFSAWSSHQWTKPRRQEHSPKSTKTYFQALQFSFSATTRWMSARSGGSLIAQCTGVEHL